MESFMFGFSIATERRLDGFILISLFAMTEKYAKARAVGIMRDAFPNRDVKLYDVIDDWTAAGLAALEEQEVQNEQAIEDRKENRKHNWISRRYSR